MDEDDDWYEDECDETCECSDCEGLTWDGESRGWCSRCNTREDHFLEIQEIYVCDCEAAGLIDAYGPEFPIILARPLRKPAHA